MRLVSESFRLFVRTQIVLYAEFEPPENVLSVHFVLERHRLDSHVEHPDSLKGYGWANRLFR